MGKSDYFHRGIFTKDEKEAFESLEFVRRPTVLYRGKPLSEEELIQLLINEEPCLQGWAEDGTDILDGWTNSREYGGVLGTLLQRRGFPWETSMVLADGTIFGRGLLVKYPDWYDIIPQYEGLAERNPYLDMVIGITGINESPCHHCSMIDYYQLERAIYRRPSPDNTECMWFNNAKCVVKWNRMLREDALAVDVAGYISPNGKDALDGVLENAHPYAKTIYNGLQSSNMPLNVEECLVMTLHIHDGVLEMLTGRKAKDKFMEYSDRYSEFYMFPASDPYFFGKCNHNFGMKMRVHFNNAFMRKCCERIAYADLWDEKIVPILQAPFSDDDVEVVTKEWLREKYNEAFNGTSMEYGKVKKFIDKKKK